MRLLRSVLAGMMLAGIASAERCTLPPIPAPTDPVNPSTTTTTPTTTATSTPTMSTTTTSPPAPTPTPTPTSTSTSTSTPTPMPTPTATSTATPTTTQLVTSQQTPTPTPSLTVPVVTGTTPAATASGSTASGFEHVQVKIRRGDLQSRSVNLGAWLVSEHWMSWESPLFDGLPENVANRGEHAIMKELGLEAGTAAFQLHRDFWINETHIEAIAAAGLNTVRVPVGFWIVCDDDSPSYEYGLRSGCVQDQSAAPGDSQINTYARGSLAYLDKLVNDWAVKYNLAVMLSLHAHQGSQNGYEHSAPVQINDLNWFLNDANRDNSINFATFLAMRYESSEAFLGMNIMNEPRIDYSLDYTAQHEFLKTYYENAYKSIRDKGMGSVIALSTMISEQSWDHLAGLLDDGSYTNIWHELHPYFIWGYENVPETEILTALDKYRDENLIPSSKNTNIRLFLGEWCMGGPPVEKGIFSDMDNFHELGRKQLAMYDEYATGGWAFWSWRHSDDSIDKLTGWSLRALLRNGDLDLSV